MRLAQDGEEPKRDKGSRRGTYGESAARPFAKSPQISMRYRFAADAHVARREAPARSPWRSRCHRICAFRRATPSDEVRSGLLILRRAEGPSRRMRATANTGCFKRIAATKEHACMAETTQHTPYLPLAGRSDDAFWRRRGGGNFVAHPLCCLSAMPPPQRRASRAAGPPRKGEVCSASRGDDTEESESND
jgi:hypothetical protein